MVVHPAGAVGTLVPVASLITICVRRTSPALTPAGTPTVTFVRGCAESVSGPVATNVMNGTGVGAAVVVAEIVAVGVGVEVGATTVAVGITGVGVETAVGVVVGVAVLVGVPVRVAV